MAEHVETFEGGGAAKCPEYATKDVPKATGTFEGIDTPGYPKLADLMAQYNQAAIFRRFRSLNLFNLMRMQAELVELEDRLRETFKSNEKGNPFLLQDFFEMSNSEDDELRDLLVKIDQTLQNYNKCLLELSHVASLKSPHKAELHFIHKWLKGLESGEGQSFLRGSERLTWNVLDINEFFVMGAERSEADAATGRTVDWLITTYNHILGRRIKRNRGATLAKSPPGSPIRPIRKRLRQQTLDQSSSSITPSLPLRPTKPTYTSTPTAFNSSQVDEDEYEEEGRVRILSSELESSESEEEDDIACNNEYLDQDLEELGPDRLDREDTDESDIEKDITDEFKTSKYFLPKGSHKSIFAPLETKKAPLPPVEEDEDIFEDINSSDDDDDEFNQQVEKEHKAEDNFIKLDDLNDVEFIDSGRSELLLDLLISDAITFDSFSFTPRTYREVLTDIKS
ncbi:hypothetical protein ACEPPN_005611 [Leptodophora sp. 'Broadleaf-Isolate-01']